MQRLQPLHEPAGDCIEELVAVPDVVIEGGGLIAIRGSFDEEFTVADFIPPTAYALEGGIPRLTARIEFQLEHTESGTLVGMTFTWRLGGSWKLMAPLFRHRMNREYRQTFAQVLDRLGDLAGGRERAPLHNVLAHRD